MSVTDFWRRWHISLTSWFREYIYIPLGGNRRGAAKKCLFVWITFTLSGLWHGAEWSFVLWGVLYALLMDLEFLLGVGKPRKRHPAVHMLQCLITFLIVCFLWVFFRAANIGEALYVVRHSLWGIGSPVLYCRTAVDQLFTALGLGMAEIVMLLGTLLLLFLFDLADERRDAIAMVSSWPAAVRWACYLGLVLIVLVFGVYGPRYDVRAFAYFDF